MPAPTKAPTPPPTTAPATAAVSSGCAEDGECGPNVIAADDGAFAINSGGEALVCVDNLGMDEVLRSIRKDELARVEMEGGSAMDAMTAANLGDSSFNNGSGWDEDAAVLFDGIDELGGEWGAALGACGGEGLAHACAEGCADGKFAVAMRHAGYNASVDILF